MRLGKIQMRKLNEIGKTASSAKFKSKGTWILVEEFYGKFLIQSPYGTPYSQWSCNWDTMINFLKNY